MFEVEGGELGDDALDGGISREEFRLGCHDSEARVISSSVWAAKFLGHAA